jgi:hypothetical protein
MESFDKVSFRAGSPDDVRFLLAGPAFNQVRLNSSDLIAIDPNPGRMMHHPNPQLAAPDAVQRSSAVAWQDATAD